MATLPPIQYAASGPAAAVIGGGDKEDRGTGRRVAAVIEFATVALFVVLAMRWAWTQNGWFEPYTVICGCVLICLEMYRRSGTKEEAKQAETQPPKAIPAEKRS
jgi:hypothetical protein